MERFILALFAVSLLTTFSGPVLADCGGCCCSKAEAHRDDKEAINDGEVINRVCPITGSKVDEDTPYKAVYKGKTIGFCCAGCIKAFEKSPEKYIEKIEGEEKE